MRATEGVVWFERAKPSGDSRRPPDPEGINDQYMIPLPSPRPGLEEGRRVAPG